MPIGGLQSGCSNAMVVALVIGKSEPRMVTMKRDGSLRWVTNFTLRDSPADMINFTIWCDREEASLLKNNFHVGEVVVVERPTISQRDVYKTDNFNPVVTSPFQLGFLSGKTVLSLFNGNPEAFSSLQRIPSKASSTFLRISDILTNCGGLKNHFCDLLAAVRSVGEDRVISVRDPHGGDARQQKTTRDVRLFDQSSDCLILKLWDNELVGLAADWLPRDTILFLADLRITEDAWRGCFVVTANSKTVVTVNPDTREAALLRTYAQVVDFSSISRLDQYASSLDPRKVDWVVNCRAVRTLLRSTVPVKDSLVAVCLYATIARLDLDCEEAISLRCGSCAGPLKDVQCNNLECREFGCERAQRSAVRHQYAVMAEISDETGGLAGVKVGQSLLERHCGPPSEFCTISDKTRTEYKYNLVWKPLKMCLALMLPTGQSKVSHLLLVDAVPVSYEEMCARMPMPTH